MIISIQDEFDLGKTVYSGQCFRPRRLSDGSYLFITGDKYLVISHISGDEYEVSCDEQTWNEVWFDYFDLGLNYSKVRASIHKDDTFMIESAIAGEGIRILRQNKWEMVISYIISQRKSIPAIRSAVEKICTLYGQRLGEVDGEVIYSFPTSEQMKDASIEELSGCGLGYRVPYIVDAMDKVLKGSLSLEELEGFDDDALFASLKSVHGIGDKVANCVMLFAYHRTGRAPVDTWILKVMNERYSGNNPFDCYGQNAGIMQQYVFYYVQNRKGLS